MDAPPVITTLTSWSSTSRPSIWAAVAATGSFVTAILVWLVQRRTLYESLRPDLILSDWIRESPGASGDALIFRRIENVGHGVALNE